MFFELAVRFKNMFPVTLCPFQCIDTKFAIKGEIYFPRSFKQSSFIRIHRKLNMIVMIAIRTIFTLALTGLAVSAPTVGSSTDIIASVGAPIAAAHRPPAFIAEKLSKADIAAAFSPTGLNISRPSLESSDSSVSALANYEVPHPLGTIYCETSDASPNWSDVYVCTCNSFRFGIELTFLQSTRLSRCRTQCLPPSFMAALSFSIPTELLP